MFTFNKNEPDEDRITNKSPPIEPKPKPKDKQKITILQKPASNTKKVELEAKDKGPLRLEAKVLHYQSPSLIYISLVHQQKAFNELYENMQKYYLKNETQGREEWNVGDRCCTVCQQSQTWRRAVVIERDGDNAKVFYSDFAYIETVPITSLKELNSDFASIGDAAIKCHLSGVIPAIGEEWPSLTKEFLKELLDAYIRVFITKSGNFHNKSMPVDMWVYHTTQGGALEPNISEWRCLNKKIIEQGLGIPDKSKEDNKPDAPAKEDEEMLSFLNITGSVLEWLQLEPMPVQPEEPASRGTSPASNNGEAVESDDQPVAHGSNMIYISEWLPPEPLPSKEFTAVPTNIGNDGVIYLHDVTQQDTLDLIAKALEVRFKNPDPKAKYSKWTVNEPCIAIYYLDNRFHRGRVLEVNEEASKCLIHYIDYGNEEYCTFTDLRKSIALYQIPIQAHKCILDRIRPAGALWDRQALDYIHKSIVEKQCYIKVTGKDPNGLTLIELKYDKLLINDHLVDFEMAEYTDGSKAIIPKFVPHKPIKYKVEVPLETTSEPDYIVVEKENCSDLSTSQQSLLADSADGTKDWNELIKEEEENLSTEACFVTFPKNDKTKFVCNITAINDTNLLELNIINDDETSLEYEKMFENLQKESAGFKPLNGIFENKACLALYPEDGQWYRASILQFSETKNLLKVKYVDYGNIETISLTDAREIDEEWLILPPSTMSAKLFGVRVNPTLDLSVILQEYKNVLLDKGPFHAEVISYENLLPYVELRNDDGELVYDKLIQDKIYLVHND